MLPDNSRFLGLEVVAWVLLLGTMWKADLRGQGAAPGRQMITSQHVPTMAQDEQVLLTIRHKLTSIVIPSIEFRSTTIEDAVEFLRQESRRLDNDPRLEARGINILLKLPPAITVPNAGAAAGGSAEADIPGLPKAKAGAGGQPTGKARISLTLSRVPLLEALKYVASQAGLKVKVEPYAVLLVPLSEETDPMATAVFRVPPSFIDNVTSGGGTALDQPASAPR